MPNGKWICSGGKAYKGRDMLKAKPRVRKGSPESPLTLSKAISEKIEKNASADIFIDGFSDEIKKTAKAPGSVRKLYNLLAGTGSRKATRISGKAEALRKKVVTRWRGISANRTTPLSKAEVRKSNKLFDRANVLGKRGGALKTTAKGLKKKELQARLISGAGAVAAAGAGAHKLLKRKTLNNE